jgi:hypothetical protein
MHPITKIINALLILFLVILLISKANAATTTVSVGVEFVSVVEQNDVSFGVEPNTPLETIRQEDGTEVVI